MVHRSFIHFMYIVHVTCSLFNNHDKLFLLNHDDFSGGLVQDIQHTVLPSIPPTGNKKTSTSTLTSKETFEQTIK